MIFLAFIAFAMPSTLQFFCFTPTDVIWSVAFSLSRISSTSSEPTYADFFGFWITIISLSRPAGISASSGTIRYRTIFAL